MTRVVISERFGGYGFSPAAKKRLHELGVEGESGSYGFGGDLPRDDARVVQVVEELGEAASSDYARLVVVEVPDDVKWHVHEYDGYETLHEDHRSWGSDGLNENC